MGTIVKCVTRKPVARLLKVLKANTRVGSSIAVYSNSALERQKAQVRTLEKFVSVISKKRTVTKNPHKKVSARRATEEKWDPDANLAQSIETIRGVRERGSKGREWVFVGSGVRVHIS